MITDRRSFLRGLGALVAVALCKPVEALAVPPRKLLAASPLLDWTEGLKKLYPAESIEHVGIDFGYPGSQVFWRLHALPGHEPDVEYHVAELVCSEPARTGRMVIS